MAEEVGYVEIDLKPIRTGVVVLGVAAISLLSLILFVLLVRR